MRGPIVVAVFLLVFSMTPQWAQAPAERPGTEEEPQEVVVAVQELNKDDHVTVMLRNGQNFEGHVVKVSETSLTLDFTLSLQQVAGEVTFPLPSILVAKRLPPLTPEDRRKRLELRRQKAMEARERWTRTVLTAVERAAEGAELTPEQQEQRRRAEERRQIEEYRTILLEFPPEEGWGPERLAQIRWQHFIVGPMPTNQEWRFWQVFDQWSEAHTMVELYEQRQKQEQEVLLTLFAQAEGWGPAVKQQLEEKQQAGQELTALEARFLKDYSRWQEAVSAQKAQQPTPAPPPPTPEPGPPPSAE